MTESTLEAVSRALWLMEDLKQNYDITLRVNKNGYCAAYLNEITPRGKTLRKQVEWETDTPKKADEFIEALQEICAEENAIFAPIEENE